MLQSKGCYNESVKLTSQSLKIRQKLLGDQHPKVALTLNNLSLNLLGLGKLEESLKYSKMALILLKQTYGPSHGYYGIC